MSGEPYRERGPIILTYAYAFPGQGAFDLRSLPLFLERYEKSRRIFACAKQILGADFTDNLLNARTEALRNKKQLQAGIVLANLLAFQGALEVNTHLESTLPTVYVGHSLGEWSAYVAAEAVALEEALSALQVREIEMNKIPGKMVRVKKTEQEIDKLCQGTPVAITLVNKPDFIVIGGAPAAVDVFLQTHKLNGRDLDVPVLSHHQDLKPTQEAFATYLETVQFKKPKRPILVNAGSIWTDDPAEIRAAASAQLVSPVHIPHLIEAMKSHGVEIIMEFGTKKLWGALVSQGDLPSYDFTNPQHFGP